MKDTIITDENVYWEMEWGEKFPDKPAVELVFEKNLALSRLLAEEVVFLNTHWYMEDWPEAAQKTIIPLANCNDIFAWGCADAEEIDFHEIQDLYDHWIKDPRWGVAVWCIKKRKLMPQKPVFDRIKQEGIWDLEEIERNFPFAQ